MPMNWKEFEEATGLEVEPLPAFLEKATPLSDAEKRKIADQALLLMEELYVHLPLKRAMHAVDPVQRLKLLRRNVPAEREFHEELIEIFAGVRDLHTNYILPAPYRSATAILPFEIGEFLQGGRRRYVVLRTFLGFQDTNFKPGAILTHWSGVPFDRAVVINGERHAGSNVAARRARGFERMTIRPLMMSLPPDEEWVDVRFRSPSGDEHEARFDWHVVSPPAATEGPSSPSGALDLEGAAFGERLSVGVDVQTESVRVLKDQVVSDRIPKLLEAAKSALEGGAFESVSGVDFNQVSHFPDIFSFGSRPTAHGTFGYIRIATFDPRTTSAVPQERVGKFVSEFRRILGLVPDTGLILDVRGNGGGNIVAGERLLQMLTSKTIEPERLHFINTDLVLDMCKRLPSWFSKWTPSVERSLSTGAVFSQGWPIEEPSSYNDIGRQYQGPVVLVTDAFCYSTTDIFAAGFQDHEIGKVLGVDAATGAGGANVFDWDLLKLIFDNTSGSKPIEELPKGATLRVAIRRTTRVRDRSGQELEDLGVEPDVEHELTLEDLLDDDRDLVEVAGNILAGG